MTTSGSYDFASTVTRNDIIDFALRKIHVKRRGMTTPANEVSDAATALNLIIQQWKERSDGAPSLKLWLRKRIRIFLENGKDQYDTSDSTDHIVAEDDLVTTAIKVQGNAGDTFIDVNSITGIADADNIGIQLDDGSMHWTTVNGTPGSSLWRAQSAAESNQWRSIAWSPELSLFVAVSDSGTNRVMTSPDGVNWTARTAAEANSWFGVTWSPELSLFVAVSQNGTNRVMTSPDGINWTARTAAEANSWYSVTWSSDLGLFAAVSLDGTNRVMTSTDGITWSAQAASEANQWYSVTWSSDLGLFAAVSYDGTNRVMTSPDGSTWTARAAAEANNWRSVVWSSSLTLFVAVASSGTNRVMTSPDGTTWTARSAPANTWVSVAWSSSLGKFIAVSPDTGTDQIMISSNGTTWSLLAAPEANYWHSVIWAASLGVFVAVSYNGTNRVMTSTISFDVPLTAALPSKAAKSNAVYSYTTNSQPPVEVITRTLKYSTGSEAPMEEMHLPDYDYIPDKTVIGTPAAVYYERRRVSGVFYLDVNADNDLDQIRMTVHYPIQDLDAAGDNLDFPGEWHRALGWMLAMDLAPEYGVPFTPEMQTNLTDAIVTAKASNPESTELFFEPERLD